MNISFASALMGTAMMLTATSAFAATAIPTQNGPVHLDRVQIAQSYGPENNFQPGLVTVNFTNQNPVPATKVVFDLLGFDGSVIAQYDDRGSFPQGVAFRHKFSNTHLDENQQLQVAEVTFADGTTWSDRVPQGSSATLFPAE